MDEEQALIPIPRQSEAEVTDRKGDLAETCFFGISEGDLSVAVVGWAVRRSETDETFFSHHPK
ncbi:MAG: hypothetical protein ABI165_12640 [Bryobacteraceae bacterium]